MLNMLIKFVLPSIAFIGINFILIACSSRSSSPPLIINDVSSEKYSSFKEISSINEVLILPVFQRSSNPASRQGNQLALPDTDLSYLLTRIVEIYTTLEVIFYPPDSSNTFEDKYGIQIPAVGISQEALFKLAKKSQEKTGASSVLFTLVEMSDERTGSKIGSERSSSLTYRMWLYDGTVRAVVWSSAYRSNKGTLSDNLFSFGTRAREGFKFKSNKDLVSAAFRGSVIKLEEELGKSG